MNKFIQKMRFLRRKFLIDLKVVELADQPLYHTNLGLLRDEGIKCLVDFSNFRHK